MKHIKRNGVAVALALLGLVGLVGAANAATTADLSVTGTIKSPACDVSLSDGGIVDFGQISRTLLLAADTAAIGARDVTATVTCTAKTLVLLKVEDNKASEKPGGSMKAKFDGATVPGENRSYVNAELMGLGQSHTDSPIGAYVLAFGRPTVDSVLATYIYANSDGITNYDNYATTALVYRENTNVYFGANAGGGAHVNMPGMQHTFPMAVAVSLDKSGNIPGDQDIDLSGSATLEVVYL